MDKIQEILEGVYGLMKELREFRHEMNEFRQEANDRLDKLESRMERLEDNVELLGNKTGKHEMQIFHLQRSIERKGF